MGSKSPPIRRKPAQTESNPLRALSGSTLSTSSSNIDDVKQSNTRPPLDVDSLPYVDVSFENDGNDDDPHSTGLREALKLKVCFIFYF